MNLKKLNDIIGFATAFCDVISIDQFNDHYIIKPTEIIKLIGCYPDIHDMELIEFFDYLLYDVQFTQWFLGR